MPIPIAQIPGVTLVPGDTPGISKVVVQDFSQRNALPWDRYVRLKAASDAVLASKCHRILDAGGYDGALALFLPEIEIDLIDPATTGGSILEIHAGDRFYDAVVAVDVLEHIRPDERERALSEFARVSKTNVILNYPCRASKEAQELAFKLTNNPLLREHVDWELPDSDWVLSELFRHGFTGTVKPHSSVAIWLGQYILLNLLPDASQKLNSHLVQNYADEPFSQPLYHLLRCRRNS